MSKAEKNRSQLEEERGRLVGKDRLHLTGREERIFVLGLRSRRIAGQDPEKVIRSALLEVTSTPGVKAELSTDDSPLK